MPPETDHSPAAARAALVVAAARRSTITHAELARALDLDGGPPAEQVRGVLEAVAEECARRQEPRLDALVVDGESGRPGPGWHEDERTWPREVVRCHRWWSER